MHIDGWHVDGFGVFSGYGRRGLSKGLTVFVGPNEAGKSTLLAFLRWVLVGYPSRGVGDHYPPLHGGEHGGRVFLEGTEGEIVVERMVRSRTPHVIFPDRVEQGDEILRRLLGGVDAGLFNSVFAFSLTELQDLKSLTGEGVRDRIFSAGIAGAGRSARQVVARLDKEAAELLRPRKGGTINTLMERLSAAESAASEARAASGEYPALLLEEEESAQRVKVSEEQEEVLRGLSDRYQMLLELWPHQYDLDEAQRELDALGPVHDLPADSEARLAGVHAALDTGRRKVTELQLDLEDARKNIDSASESLRPELPTLSSRIEETADRAALHEDRLEAMPEIRGALLRAEERLARASADLGPGWDEERIRAFDLSLARQEEIREWGLRLAASARSVEEDERMSESAMERVRQVEIDRDRVRDRLQAILAPDGSLLRSQEASLRRLRAGLQEARESEVEASGLRAAVADRERALAVARAVGAGAGGARGAGESIGWVVGASALVCLIIAAFLGVMVGPAWGLAVGVIAVTLGVVAYLTLRADSRSAGSARAAAEASGLEAALKTAQSTLAALEARVAELADRIAEDATVLDLSPRPEWSEVERREGLVLETRESLRTRLEVEQRLVELEDDLVDAQAAAERRTASLDRVRASHERLLEEWSAWKSSLGIPVHLEGDGVGEFLRVVREARKSLESRGEAFERHQQLLAGSEAWKAQTRQLLEEAGLAADTLTRESLVRTVRELHSLCRADRSTRDKLDLLEDGLRLIEAKLASARAEVAAAEEERDAVLREAGVTDEAAFQRLLAALERRRGLEAGAAEARRVLDTRLGKGPRARESQLELATGRVDVWERDAARTAGDLEEARREKIEAIRRHRDAERSRQVLEESSDVAARELEVAGIREELQTALRRWQVVTAAKILIEDTLAEYSRTRQPPVLREASAGFARVTGGAYKQIMERDDAEGFVVVDDRGGLKRPEELSRGTLEQLYLSLRLGLAREFGRRAAAVPVIMDDVLVNFDPGRARATAEILASFAAEHQVLFFTCHPATAELLRRAHPATEVVELGAEGSAQTTLWES
ncbi:MAG: AAA family ATPase [Thermoleophilia bacterium]